MVVLYQDGSWERFWGSRMKVPRGCKEVLEKAVSDAARRGC